uniref:Probable glycerol kinase n=1 Tax=Setaria digitata TaxID=48799 RepID=A0A915PKF9_9BILA
MEIKTELIGAIDQSTSSTRFMIYQLNSRKVITSHQIEIKQFFPYPGWVELDPEEILATTIKCIDECCGNIKKAGFDINDIKAIGICNQRETTILWDCETGNALYNAICWLDNRTIDLANLFIEKTSSKSKEEFRNVTGLPIHSYFSALKIRWLLDNVDSVKDSLNRGNLMFGTVDSWLIYKLTGRHITDVTNASRTMLMSIKTLNWDKDICDFFGIPINILPKIHPSAEIYDTISKGILKGVPLAGCLGDQQAAMFGEHCFETGEAKCTYGTGTFVLINIGTDIVINESGMVTTVAYQASLGSDEKVCYALEGSGSIGGNAIRFLRDNLQFIKDASEVEPAAASVSGTDGVIFVPCFTGLYAPYWDSTARGIICGLVQTTKKAHIIRAVLEAVCFQTEEMIEAVRMNLPDDQKLKIFKVDGGMTVNSLFLQLLSDITGMEVIKSAHTEASCWGAAMVAAIGAKIISFEDIRKNRTNNETIWKPNISVDERRLMIDIWKKAINRARGWLHDQKTEQI